MPGSLSQQIATYLKGKGSPLAPYANDFVQVGNKYGIDPRFLVAISGAETSFAKAGSGLRNPFGWNSARKYSGPREVLELLGAGLVRNDRQGNYKGKSTISQIGGTWAPPNAANDAGGNAGWPSAVGQFYREQGGNPNAQVTRLGKGQYALGSGGAGTEVSPGLAQVTNAIPGGPQRLQQLQGISNALSPQMIGAIKGYASKARSGIADRTYTKNSTAFAEIRDRLISNIKNRPAQIPGALGAGLQTLNGGQGPAAIGGPVTNGVGGGGQQILDYGGGGKVGRILPTPLGGSSYGYSDPEGQNRRHLAQDWMAKAGTGVASPVSGTVFRVKADPNPGKQASGQVFGGTVYIKGDDGKLWIMRHMESPSVRQGQRVQLGQRVGAVKNWGGSSHIHLELYAPGPYSYSSARAMDPYKYLTQRGIK